MLPVCAVVRLNSDRVGTHNGTELKIPWFLIMKLLISTNAEQKLKLNKKIIPLHVLLKYQCSFSFKMFPKKICNVFVCVMSSISLPFREYPIVTGIENSFWNIKCGPPLSVCVLFTHPNSVNVSPNSSVGVYVLKASCEELSQKFQKSRYGCLF